MLRLPVHVHLLLELLLRSDNSICTNMKKYIKKIAIAVCLGFVTTSCSDFLNITPLNDVVLENYWTNKNDVQSVVTSCYAGLENADCIKRMACWGEVRSDDIITGLSTPDDEKQILLENILPTNSYTAWTSFYQVINRCNTVLYYAPMVAEKDPNYTQSELLANIAEVKAIRDLCYFYLIRTFRDVPFVMTPSIDDTQDYKVAPSSFDTILTALIADLESVKDNAVKAYPTTLDNTSKITRWSIYSILADMYLWKQDYNNCIKYCDLVIDYKKAAYQTDLSANRSNSDLALYHGYPLIDEQTGGANSGNAYSDIFGTGNSFESLFELNFVNNQSVTNSFVHDYYGSSTTNVGYYGAPDFLFENAYAGTNSVFTPTDCRYLEDMKISSSNYSICKYTNTDVSFNNTTSTTAAQPDVQESRRNTSYANWIIYRFTDVLLMKAEAEIELSGDVVSGALTQNQSANYQDAFSLITAVYNRANNISDNDADSLVYDTYATSRSTMENFMYQERQREFLFEGKRWYDLVRMARRDGYNTRLVNFVISKYTDNTSAIRIKLSSPDILYFPYNVNELKANSKLTQNPAYITDKTITIGN